MRILHFVTGGFSGATKVAIDLITAHNNIENTDNLLVLRQKKTTTESKLAELDAQNVDYKVITGSTHLATISALKQLCESWQPDIVVAHGFPEHLLGRRAALLAKVPHIIQVEHNSQERYSYWTRYQTRKLSASTSQVIAVSEGVAQVLSQQNLKAPITAIPNGIDTSRFGSTTMPTLTERPDDLIMVARYAKSKDHVTLIKALHLLKRQNIIPKLTLVGSGRKYYQQEVESLVKQYHLDDQVNFVAYSNEVDKLLLRHKVFIMSSRFEGLNLAVLEAMASGCVVIGSRAMGVEELIDDSNDGFLFPIGDAAALADIIKQVIYNLQDYQSLTVKARQKVLQSYDKTQVTQAYYDVFKSLKTDIHQK